jgi:hypothetical protein
VPDADSPRFHLLSTVAVGKGDSSRENPYFLAIFAQELKHFPTFCVEVSNAALKSLNRMREESKKNTLTLVDMECDY